MSNQELVRVDEVLDIELRRDPEVVLEAASKAAKALQRVVESKPKKVMIAGRQHLQYEDWQTLGQFYSYTVRTMEPKFVEVDGVKGAYARAEVIDFRTGLVVGGAEAYCMSDEENWAGKPWFQLASMAQTRAGAKALRNRLAWVAVLAGYEATPAEEMTGNEYAHPDKKPEHFCDKHSVAFRRFEKNGRVWYSHKDGDSWCNEAKAREVEPEQPKGNSHTQAPKPIDNKEASQSVARIRSWIKDKALAIDGPDPKAVDDDKFGSVVVALKAVADKHAVNEPDLFWTLFRTRPGQGLTQGQYQAFWSWAKSKGYADGIVTVCKNLDKLTYQYRVDHEPPDQRPDTVEDGADVPGMDELERDAAMREGMRL